jgi:hypothetical protein
MNETTTETLGDVVDRQAVVPTWLGDLLRENGADAVVEVVTKNTPWGSYLLTVKPA